MHNLGLSMGPWWPVSPVYLVTPSRTLGQALNPACGLWFSEESQIPQETSVVLWLRICSLGVGEMLIVRTSFLQKLNNRETTTTTTSNESGVLEVCL